MTQNPSTIEALRAARVAEKDQARFYRALAAAAEAAGDAATAERLNGLLADEQHHLSRLTARLVELGQPLDDLPSGGAAALLEGWEESARARERDEIDRYERLLSLEPDPVTETMISRFLAAERRHAAELGGKWMDA